MTLQHFYSDWNGQQTDKPYMKKPTNHEINQAHNGTHAGVKVFSREHGEVIIIMPRVVEVRQRIGNSITANTYRDMYRIVE